MGAKGKLILKGNFGVFKSSKKRTKKIEGFLPKSLRLFEFGTNISILNFFQSGQVSSLPSHVQR